MQQGIAWLVQEYIDAVAAGSRESFRVDLESVLAYLRSLDQCPEIQRLIEQGESALVDALEI